MLALTAELRRRTSRLDYLDAQKDLRKIFTWEKGNRVDKTTTELVEIFCAAHAFPTGPILTPNYIADTHGHMAKHPPNGTACVTSLSSSTSNPDVEMFPDQGSYTQRHGTCF